jgi:hypothetical protein
MWQLCRYDIAYRVDLACGFLYKAFLAAQPNLPSEYISSQALAPEYPPRVLR